MNDTEKLRRRIADSAAELLAEGKTAGCAVRIAQSGELLLSAEFGCADTDSGEPLRQDAVFRLASMTKPITAAAILLCEERGLLSVSDRLSEHLDGFSGLLVYEPSGSCRPPVREITLLDLLSHTAGFGTDEDAVRLDSLMSMAGAKSSLRSAVRFYSENARLTFDPGSRRSYSPTAAFDLLAAVVKRVSGQSIEHFAYENIFLPLGMRNSSFELTPSLHTGLVGMHDLEDGKPVIRQMDNIFSDHPLGYHCGGAGIVSTADDYLRFAELLRVGLSRDTAVLSRRSVQRMCTPVTVPGDEQEQPSEVFGCGVRVTLRDGILPCGCFGWSGAYGTHFWIDPRNEITAVLMRNSFYDGGAGSSIARRFERDVMSALSQDSADMPRS